MCAAVARTVGAQRETTECVPLLRQRAIARARTARAVGRENEARRHALWLLDELEGRVAEPEPDAPRSAVRVLPGFHPMPAADRRAPAEGEGAAK
jgi:hypothetical protein